jgi:transcriptional regulator with XRE-family HTH domain
MADIREVVGGRLRQARVEAGLTQEALAEQLGLTGVGYGGMERGRTLIGVDVLLEVCRILGRPVTYFIGGGVVEIGDVSDETREVVALMEQLVLRERVAVLLFARFVAKS